MGRFGIHGDTKFTGKLDGAFGPKFDENPRDLQPGAITEQQTFNLLLADNFCDLVTFKQIGKRVISNKFLRIGDLRFKIVKSGVDYMVFVRTPTLLSLQGSEI